MPIRSISGARRSPPVLRVLFRNGVSVWRARRAKGADRLEWTWSMSLRDNITRRSPSRPPLNLGRERPRVIILLQGSKEAGTGGAVELATASVVPCRCCSTYTHLPELPHRRHRHVARAGGIRATEYTIWCTMQCTGFYPRRGENMRIIHNSDVACDLNAAALAELDQCLSTLLPSSPSPHK